MVVAPRKSVRLGGGGGPVVCESHSSAAGLTAGGITLANRHRRRGESSSRSEARAKSRSHRSQKPRGTPSLPGRWRRVPGKGWPRPRRFQVCVSQPPVRAEESVARSRSRPTRPARWQGLSSSAPHEGPTARQIRAKAMRIAATDASNSNSPAGIWLLRCSDPEAPVSAYSV